jgi:hypothetical protein
MMELDNHVWSESQWGRVNLGDKRLNRRAVKVGAAMGAQPSASIPTQMGSWAATRRAYDFFASPGVTHQAVSQPHWEQTIQQSVNAASKPVIFIQDSTQLDYSTHKATEDLGRIGEDRGRGLMLHSCLVVVPELSEPAVRNDQCQILGLAAQQIWARPPQPWRGRETRTQRASRPRESQVWSQMLQQIGRPPAGSTWISVGDRGSDVFEYMQQAHQSGWFFLLRACQNRRISRRDTLEEEFDYLIDFARSLPPLTHYTHTREGRSGLPSEEITLEVSCQKVDVHAPWNARDRNLELPVWVIRCWGKPMHGSEIEWILLSNVEVTDRASLLRLIRCYEHRWLIEQYHHCLKSGCNVEEARLQRADRLKPLVAMLSILAVRLLALRSLARRDPEQPAHRHIDPRMIQLLVLRLGLGVTPEELTIGQFWRSVARLGGFLARKSDGEPGWITLWRGWLQLQTMFDAINLLPRFPQ